MGNVVGSAREHYITVSVHYDAMGCYGSGVFAMACYGKNLNLLMQAGFLSMYCLLNMHFNTRLEAPCPASVDENGHHGPQYAHDFGPEKLIILTVAFHNPVCMTFTIGLTNPEIMLGGCTI